MDLEQIVFLILFIFPGALIKILYSRYTSVPKDTPSNYEQIIFSFLYSLTVLITNLMIFAILHKADIITQDITSLGLLKNSLMNIDFLLKYCILTLITSVIIALLFYKLNDWVFVPLYNKYRQKKHLSIETKFKTVWDTIFENPEEDLFNSYISIEKDGQLITSGLLKNYSNPRDKNKELSLVATYKVKEFLENDKLFPKEERLLHIIDKEYYDIDSGTLIKFYNKEKIEKYLNS